MHRKSMEEIILSLFALAAAAVSPNVFPAAQAGLADMPVLARRVLIPSVVLLAAVVFVAVVRRHSRLVRRLTVGAGAGLVATVALELVRMISFHLGGMPGDMPKLLGVLLTGRFMLGPTLWSNAIGYIYHYWNGISFGIIFAVLLGRRPWPWTVGYSTLIGLGFLAGPDVKAMGVGFMAMQRPSMIVTVVIAHIAYGIILGMISNRLLIDDGWLLRPAAHPSGNNRK